MEIRIADQGWTAEVIFSPPSRMDDFMHCTAMVDGETKESALVGAKVILDLFAKNRTTFVRTPPEADSDTNFDTKLTIHRGYTRFSFRLEAGVWVFPTPRLARELGLAEA